ncbi:MAG: L,D-transpeptidase [Campylobacterota bacterium]|nr:L,D-transpeptidase [Campylobacterota bacterium]
MLKQSIIFFTLLFTQLTANIYVYDERAYLEEVNQGELVEEHEVVEYVEAIENDEYRGSSVRYVSHQPTQRDDSTIHYINEQSTSHTKIEKVDQNQHYIIENGVLKLSDVKQLKEINKEEFEEIRSLNQELSIPYGAAIKVKVDIASQRMSIYANGKRYYQWKISTGTWKYPTPRGYYRPQVLKKMHYSKKYDNAPMPHSIFFKGGYAIHGTNSISRLGRKASHGCVRLHPSNAKKLFQLVKRSRRNVSIVVK